MHFLEALPRIYDSATSKDNWTETLDQVAHVTLAKGCMLLASGHYEHSFSINKSNSIYNGMEEKLEIHMRKYSNYENYGLQYLMKSPSLKPVYDIDMWPNMEKLEEREDIKYTKKILGIFRRMSFNLSNNDSNKAGIIFQYDKYFREIPSLGVENSCALAPHLAKTLELNSLFYKLREKYRAVLTVLDHVKIGICVVSPSGYLTVVNEEARRIFTLGDGIGIDRGNKIISSNEGQNNEIRNLIWSCSETASGRENLHGGRVIIQRRSALAPFMLEISPVRDGNDELERGFAGAFLTIIDPSDPPDIPITPLQKIYQITKTEAEVASLLACGHAIKEIASLPGVAENTIKHQTKSLYFKIGIHNRAQLIRKLVFLSPPIW